MLKTKSLVLILTLIGLISTANAQEGYNIEVKIKGFENQDAILGYYSNKNMYVTDTVPFNEQGVARFKNDKSLPGGVYLIYLPNGKYFDIMIDKEQYFSLMTDTTDLIENLVVEGSLDTKLFTEYQQFIRTEQSKASPLQEKIKAENDPAKKEELQAQFAKIDEEVKNYWKESAAKYPNTFYSAFIKGLQDPQAPEFVAPDHIQNKDSAQQMMNYMFYSRHYFDNIDFSDQRFLRTPYFAQKLDTYFDRMLVQNPDTLSEAAIRLIERSKTNKEMFQFVTQYLFNKFNDNKIMGMENAMVALADKYYLNGKAEWASEEFMEKLKKHINSIRPTLIGKKAHDLRMESVSGEVFRLHEINSPITILIFYEPSCGHCKKDIPKLYKTVFEPYRSKGVQAFAVYSLNDKEEWQDFINEHELFNWINVYDPYNETNFRNYFDIRATPMIYVLDKDKKIVGKRMDIDQMPGFIDYLLQK